MACVIGLCMCLFWSRRPPARRAGFQLTSSSAFSRVAMTSSRASTSATLSSWTRRGVASVSIICMHSSSGIPRDSTRRGHLLMISSFVRASPRKDCSLTATGCWRQMAFQALASILSPIISTSITEARASFSDSITVFRVAAPATAASPAVTTPASSVSASRPATSSLMVAKAVGASAAMPALASHAAPPSARSTIVSQAV
mmetsp:Transcript_2314/g.6863  ORF Transcript_2314/g.6863 Transcript_2314/m.6863 type:complete len:201 (+) Transcript_2314:1382-1984(+)